MNKEEILDMLHDCRIQLEFLNSFGQRGTTNALISRLETLIEKLEKQVE